MHKHYKLIALAAVVALVTLFLLHRSETDRILGQLEDLVIDSSSGTEEVFKIGGQDLPGFGKAVFQLREQPFALGFDIGSGCCFSHRAGR